MFVIRTYMNQSMHTYVHMFVPVYCLFVFMSSRVHISRATRDALVNEFDIEQRETSYKESQFDTFLISVVCLV